MWCTYPKSVNRIALRSYEVFVFDFYEEERDGFISGVGKKFSFCGTVSKE